MNLHHFREGLDEPASPPRVAKGGVAGGGRVGHHEVGVDGDLVRREDRPGVRLRVALHHVHVDTLVLLVALAGLDKKKFWFACQVGALVRRERLPQLLDRKFPVFGVDVALVAVGQHDHDKGFGFKYWLELFLNACRPSAARTCPPLADRSKPACPSAELQPTRPLSLSASRPPACLQLACRPVG